MMRPGLTTRGEIRSYLYHLDNDGLVQALQAAGVKPHTLLSREHNGGNLHETLRQKNKDSERERDMN